MRGGSGFGGGKFREESAECDDSHNNPVSGLR